jgi:hypothetical protein
MKKTALIVSVLVVLFTGCTKVESTRTSGIDTIDNILYRPTDPFIYGFSFSQAKLLSNTGNPSPDIILYIIKDNVSSRLTLQTNNIKSSFFKVGDYADEAAAIAAFDNLKTVSVAQWADMADPVSPNQVWIYRSGADKYTKIRIISTVLTPGAVPPFGECKFKWVHQPDGSATFPQ